MILGHLFGACMQSGQNVCAERMLETAFQRVLGRQVTFKASRNDAQIDLGPVFMATLGEGAHWFSGYDIKLLEADFAALNPEKTYFMRTGAAGAAGHWQLLSRNAEGWYGFSTETNQKQYTDRLGELTQAANEGLMSYSKATWGESQGKFSIMIQEANEARIVAAANFVRDVRLFGDDVAMENAFDPALNGVLNTSDGHLVETPRPAVVAAPVAVDYQGILDTACSNFSSVIDKTARVLTSDINGGKAFYLDAIQQYAEAHPDKARGLYEETLTKLYILNESPSISAQGKGAIAALSGDVNDLLTGLSARRAGHP